MRGFQTEDYCKVLFRYGCRKRNISLEMDRFQVFQALQKETNFFKKYMLLLNFNLKVKNPQNITILFQNTTHGNLEILVYLWFYDFGH